MLSVIIQNRLASGSPGCDDVAYIIIVLRLARYKVDTYHKHCFRAYLFPTGDNINAFGAARKITILILFDHNDTTIFMPPTCN